MNYWINIEVYSEIAPASMDYLSFRYSSARAEF